MRIIFLTVFFLLSACSGGGGNNITEVGNPTKGTAASGTTQALVNLNQGFVEGLTAAPAALAKGVLSVETDDSYECTIDEAGTTIECTCPGGGTTTEVFTTSFSQDGNQVILNADLDITFTDCILTACEEDVAFNGNATGTIDGQVDVDTGALFIEASYATEETCAGLTAGEVPVGFSMQATFDGVTDDFSGIACIDDETFTFASLDELIAAADEDNVCTE